MQRLRNISTLLAAPLWALHAQHGSPQMIALALQLRGKQGGISAMEDAEDSERTTPEQRASYWRDFLKSTGCFPYYVNPDGAVVHSLDEDANDRLRQGAVAVVPVFGTLVQEAWTGEEVFYGLVSSERIAAFLDKCRVDQRVSAVVSNINSPGGQVNGMENLGRSARELSAAKPTEAHVKSLAASGGYWLASQFRSIRLDGQLSEVGSVGVMLSFFDVIPALESWGLKYHELYAKESDKKNEAWRQLRTEEDPEKYKKELGFVADVFRNTVKAGRGARLGSDPAALEGRMFSGQQALDAGMADSIGSLDQSIMHVRGTAKAQAPVVDPAKPDPEDNRSTNPPAGTASAATANTTTTTEMNFLNKLVAMATALFSTKEEATAENIQAANAQLKEKGVQGVVFANEADATAFATAAEQVHAAEQRATEAANATAQAEARATAAEGALQAQNASIAAAITAHGIAAQEGTEPLDMLSAALTTATADLAARTARIAELEQTPPAPASTAVNPQGDTRTSETKLDPEVAEFTEQVDRDLAEYSKI